MPLKIDPSRMSAGRPLTPIVIALFLAMSLAAACSAAPDAGTAPPGTGTPAPEAGTAPPGAATQAPTPSSPAGPGVGGPSGAPVAVTVDGRTIEYNDGQCDVSTDEVHAEATDASFNGMRVDWRADDPDETVVIIQTPPPVLLLQTSTRYPNTTAEVTVEGSRVEVRARMIEEISGELKDVVIQLDCSEEFFGSEPEVTGRVTVEVGGETYVLDALDDCRLAEDGIRVSKLAGDDGMSFTVTPDPGPGHTVQLIVDGGGWVRGPGFISDQPGVEFEISGMSATWSGLLTPQFGDEQPATITIECG